MQQEIASLVHPVLTYGLDLKARLARGERPDFDVEQAALKGLLLSDMESRRWIEFGGDPETEPTGLEEVRLGEAGPRGGRQFLGIRYALVCWLDELFISDSPWASEWSERKLEVELYSTNDRAWRFWEQARRAESLPAKDALEAIYLCVMLGFRGELREQPDKLRAWVAAAQQKIAQIKEQEWPYPLDLDLPPQVPPLRGQARLQRVVLAAAVAILLLIPFVAFFVVQRLGQ